MKASRFAALAAFACLPPLHAQFAPPTPVTPTTPTRFGTRNLGNTSSSGVIGITPAKPAVTRQVTHIVIGQPRQWKMTDGKSFVGKLIAFEDLVVEMKAGEATPAPVVPPKPTVVQNGNARFLVNSKPYTLALARLGEEERKVIEETRAALAAKK